jgi:hypothetical protein
MGVRRGLVKPESMIPPPPSKAKRNRHWDAEHKNITAYRGIDPDVANQVRDLAERLDVPIGEVAQALLAHALEEYQSGRLELHPALKTGKFTLFHGNGQ